MSKQTIAESIAESVTEGHPDKVCDQISDAVVDAVLSTDNPGDHLEWSRVACETLIARNQVIVAGQINWNNGHFRKKLQDEKHEYIGRIIRNLLRDIGYTSEEIGIDCDGCNIDMNITEQSDDLVQKEIGAGDQGTMYGYATNETPEYMPLSTVIAHKLTKGLSDARRNGDIPYLRPDGKSQVIVSYAEKEPRIQSITIAAQHAEEDQRGDIQPNYLEKDIRKFVIDPVIKFYNTSDMKCTINGAGRFVLGGPKADTGLTGRKIMVDAYGSECKHGGGCASGKDPTKVDRSAFYAARYIAKNIVAAGLAKKCEIRLAYSIAKKKPDYVGVDTFGTGKLPEKQLRKIIQEAGIFPLGPFDIIRQLNLWRPIYCKTATYGHFGRIDIDAPWEKTDKIEPLKHCHP